MAQSKSWARFLAAALLAFASSAHAQLLVGVNPYQNDSTSPPSTFGLFHLDSNTGAITDSRVITVPARTITGATSITTDPTTGRVYAVLKAAGVSWRLLVTLNVATGAGIEIGNLGDNFSSISFRSDGQLFGVTGDGAVVRETLYLIDKTSAAKVFAATLGNGADGEVIAYHPGDDAFYHWSGNSSIVFERISAQAPYAVTAISTGAIAGGEIFGAVWDPARSVFLTHNIGATMATLTTAGVRTSLGMAVADVRGMALLPPPPAVISIVRAGANPTNATSVDFTMTFSDAVTGVDAADFGLTASGTAAGTISGVAGSGTTWTVTVGSVSGEGTLRLDLVDDDSITNGTNVLGGIGSGNGDFATGAVYTIDRTAPVVTGVAVPANGTYTAGQALQFTVTLDEAAIVDTTGGTPFLALTIGSTARNAAYVSGSGSTTLTFVYTVQLGDIDGDGIALGAAISLNGGTIRDAATNDAALTLNGIASTTGVLVNAPFIFTVTPSAGANGSITPATPQIIASGATTAFTVTPSSGYTASVGGTCGGALAGNTYTTNAIIANCTVAATFTQITFTVTPSAGANGSITPATPQIIASGATTAFTVTPSAGYTASVGGTCGGALAGNTYTTNAIIANCTVAATFASTAVTIYTAPSATGSGTITASFTGGGASCTYATSQFIPVTGHARSPPAGSAPSGIAFPHGLFDFTLSGCTPGSTIAFTITYPQALNAAAQYFKYGPTPGNAVPHWYVLPAAIAGNTATFSIADGALGDDDLAANGTIVDQGGPGVGSGPPVQVPTLSEWAMLLMAMLLLLSGMTMAHRRIGK